MSLRRINSMHNFQNATLLSEVKEAAKQYQLMQKKQKKPEEPPGIFFISCVLVNSFLGPCVLKAGMAKLFDSRNYKMECYATPWRLWRESRDLYIFTEPSYPGNAPLSLYL